MRSVLVVKPSSLGDVVHALPAVRLLKRRWPGWRIRWLINPEFAPLLEGNPDLEDVLIFPRGEFRGPRGAGRFGCWLKDLRQRGAGIDLALDFQGLLRSGLVAWASRARWVAGMSDSREGARWFHDEVVAVGKGDHAVDRCLALARGFGAEGEVEFLLPEGKAPVDAGLDPTGLRDFVVLHPFSRGEGKSLTVAQVGAFCRAMGTVPVVVVGRKAGGESLRFPGEAVNLLNRTTLGELMWLLRRAAFTVSVDSGPMHMAAAVSGAVLGIHTWSDPRRVGPWRKDAWVWKAGRVIRCGELGAAASGSGTVPGEGDLEEMARFVCSRLG
jgi:ADP-heptose:LPS heptosyltransferase